MVVCDWMGWYKVEPMCFGVNFNSEILLRLNFYSKGKNGALRQISGVKTSIILFKLRQKHILICRLDFRLLSFHDDVGVG
jgi:hypothetical protein